MERDDRIMEEVQRLHREVASCAHCESLRAQIGRLVALLPPAPIQRSDGRWYIFNPPPEYEAIVQELLRQHAPHLADLSPEGLAPGKGTTGEERR